MWLYHRIRHPKDAEGIANSVDPDQTVRSGLIWVCTVCPGLSVRKVRIIMVYIVINGFSACQKGAEGEKGHDVVKNLQNLLKS